VTPLVLVDHLSLNEGRHGFKSRALHEWRDGGLVARDGRPVARGLNIDRRLFGPDPDLDRPVFWLQSGSPVTLGRDELLDGLTAGGGLVTVVDSVHMGFSDYPSHFTPTGRRFFGWIGGAGSLPVDSMAPITADIVSGFFGSLLDGSSNGGPDRVASLHPGGHDRSMSSTRMNVATVIKRASILSSPERSRKG
jgi:hypothetical protein